MPHKLRFPRAAFPLALACILPAPAAFANIPAAGDFDEWTRLEFEEAFVSRQTTVKFQDGFGSPEFGWRVARDGQVLARGELYTTLYYPGAPNAPVDLSLAELDVFYDDIVATRRLTAGQTRVELGASGDFAVIRRHAFQPDARSGADRRPAGARRIAGNISDTVNFLEGDYTDYATLAPDSVVFFFSNASNMDLSAPGSGSVKFFPEQIKIRRVVIADSANGGLLRLRGPIGAGKTDYSLWLATGPNRKQSLVDSVLLQLSRGPAANDRFLLQEAGARLTEYAPEEIRRACRAQRGRSQSTGEDAGEALQQICSQADATPQQGGNITNDPG
jgi:hypothetical protein